MSEIFPIVDQIAFIHSAHGTSNDHTLSHLEWNTGSVLSGFPSVGSWVTYGLGTVNQNLPAYVVLFHQRGGPYGGQQNWASGAEEQPVSNHDIHASVLYLMGMTTRSSPFTSMAATCGSLTSLAC